MSSWRVVFQMKGTDEVAEMADGAVDAHNFAFDLWRDDRHHILERLTVEELVGDRWVVRQDYSKHG